MTDLKTNYLGDLAIKDKIDKRDLSDDATYKITASDVGVKVESGKLKVDNTAITATNVSARPNTWTPSASDVGAYSKTEIDNKNFQNATQVETAITSKGYQTASDVSNAITDFDSSLGDLAHADTVGLTDLDSTVTADALGGATPLDVSTAVNDLNTDISSRGYQNATQVDNAITSKGYQTATQVGTIAQGKVDILAGTLGDLAYVNNITSAKVTDLGSLATKSTIGKDDLSQSTDKITAADVGADAAGAASAAATTLVSDYNLSRVNDLKALAYKDSLTAAEVGVKVESGKLKVDNTAITASQVGARSDSWMPSANDVGARPNTWTPSASDVGAYSKTEIDNKNFQNATQVGNIAQGKVDTLSNSLGDLAYEDTITSAKVTDLGPLATLSKVDNRYIQKTGTYAITAADVGATTLTEVQGQGYQTSTQVNNAITTTVPSWARESSKPSYAANEISGLGALATKSTVGKNDLSVGADAITASDIGATTLTEVQNQGYQNATEVNTIVEGKGYQTSSQVNTAITTTVPSWARQSSKPSYTASEVGADASGTAASAITDLKTNYLGALATKDNITASYVTDLGALATKDTVSASTDVTGLKALAFKDNITASYVTDLGALATKSKIGNSDLSTGADKITAADVGAATSGDISSAITTYDGTLGALAKKDNITASYVTDLGSLATKSKVGKNDLSNGSDKITATDVGAATTGDISSAITTYDGTLGALAKKDNITSSYVTDLGALATKDNITSSYVTDLGSLATKSKIDKNDLSTGADKITASDVGARSDSWVPSASQVTGLGALATKDTVSASTDVTGLGSLATKSTVTSSDIDSTIYSKTEIDNKGFQNETQVGTKITGTVNQTYVNNLGITAQNITVQDNSSTTIFSADASTKLVDIAGFNVENGHIVYGTKQANNSVYVGTDGIYLGSHFSVDKTGKVIAKDTKLFGDLQAEHLRLGDITLKSVNKSLVDYNQTTSYSYKVDCYNITVGSGNTVYFQCKA